FVFFFSSRRRHTRFSRDWSSDVCSSDLDDYRTVVLVEAASRGGVPGTVSLVEPDAARAGLAVDPRVPRPFDPAALARDNGKVPSSGERRGGKKRRTRGWM